jgi:hypothetical protein
VEVELSEALADLIGIPMGRYNPVSAAYDGMSEDDRAAFRLYIQDPDKYTHAQLAKAMRELGYSIDRKQIQNFREKLALGKVIL